MARLEEMKFNDRYRVFVLTDGDRTVAEITGTYKGGEYQIGIGEAKRRPGDKRDPTVGELVALTRAFRDAARMTTRQIVARGFDATNL